MTSQAVGIPDDEAEKRVAAFRARVIQGADAALNSARHCKILHQTKAGGRLHGLTNRQQRDVYRKQKRENRELIANLERQ
jgi:hypothetical protein